MALSLPEICVLGAAGYCAFIGAQLIIRLRAARNWPSVNGKIIKSEITGGFDERQESSGFKFTYMYKPDIRYEYFVIGQRFEGNSVSWKTLSASGKSVLKNPTLEFPVGRQVEVFYNPQKPNESMLATAFPPGYFPAIPFLFAVGLLICVLTGWVSSWKF